MEQSPMAIAEAVEACVAHATGSERPFQQVADFLSLLQWEGWTSADISRVQSLSLAELVEMRRADREP